MISEDLEVKQVGPDEWQLLKPIEYHSQDYDVTVPAGFITDFFSTPQLVWTIGLPKSGKADQAAVVHDYLYKQGGHIIREDGLKMFYPKSVADQIFEDILKDLGVGQPKRWLMYQAVSKFGKGNY